MPSNPGGVLYGTLAVGVLLAGESAQRETYGETAGAVAITLVIYWLAHSYASFAAERLEQERPADLRGLVRTVGHEFSIVLGAGLPLLAVLISWAAGATLHAGISAGIWTSAGMVLLTELVSGVRAEQKGWELAGQVALGALLGFAVIALKLVLH